jgi:hypothetical protein
MDKTWTVKRHFLGHSPSPIRAGNAAGWSTATTFPARFTRPFPGWRTEVHPLHEMHFFSARIRNRRTRGTSRGLLIAGRR